MTVTYVLSTLLGKLRLAIGDKTVAAAVFTDEELQIFLDNNDDSINLAGADALEAWAASYGANADSEHIGDYSYTQKIVANLLSLAASLRAKEAAGPVAQIASWDLTTVEEIAEVE
jgi:hypothetical protein